MSFAEQIKSLQEQMQGFDINELSAENIGTWPLAIKLICWVILFAALIGGGLHFVITDLQDTLMRTEARELELKRDFETKAYQAANLEAYRQQMVDMESSFGALVSQLPSDTEVPGLLEDITNKGVSSGLAFKEISLQGEVSQEFYIEQPIRIIGSGAYHDMGAFVSGVASLPRIVTLKNFNIRPIGARGDSSNLEISIMASTYRYRESAAVPARGGR